MVPKTRQTVGARPSGDSADPGIADVGAPVLIHGNSARMAEIDSGTAALVLSGPPYFPDEVKEHLYHPPTDSGESGEVDTATQAFAWSLRPVFEECFRVLIPGGHLVIQTRDVRLRSRLLPVEAIHRQICEAVGFHLYTRHFWRPSHTTLSRRRSMDALQARYGPIPFDPEVFLIFTKPGGAHRGAPTANDLGLLREGQISTAVGRLPRRHAFQSPKPVLGALIRAYTVAGDLVVDPFAGGGTTLRVAADLGRRAIGYEVDAQAVALASVNLRLDSNAHETRAESC